MPRAYFAGGAGLALGAGEGEAAGAGAALPAVAGGLAAAAAWGWAPGLIQQTWMRLSRVSATLGSICPPKRVRQRKAAWTWPPGQPNRSYRSRCRNAVSRSSRHIRRTTRRPSQTHSGFPAGPLMAWDASTNSSALRWLSLLASAALAGGLPD